ncbi:extracellular protein, putative [Talaromyces stipitatus ATCC 10500]|uniref:Extracellular protein, putative n=1 Tax=Talaromyces stipitatus (strain ATCC 10500 / CBS 375.48 / QM 6759 / NRRL 1006) TaxID=441959 RepID=B8MQN3_TALSN|nr:extracellular protein, putative [Talaromyces stipitatus ATCC 10500]EED13456.1 extracellular protein, putative [Talaromyces stipitatus ATCC 10500]
MKTTFAICAFLAATVSAHMQMSNPYPIRSPLNPNGDEAKKDYSYTSPLDASGSNFPCKGYQNDAFKSVATYTAGGNATHGGGSCQLSLSYDTGKTFTVIQSMEGGCPLTSNYSFTIPSDAPSGQALFAWSWFNKIGNREMYMNCAQVTIEGGSGKRSHPRDMMVSRADTAFSSRPPMFIANVNGPGGCTTIESQEVNFPEAGPDVVGGVEGKGYTCTGSANFLGDGSGSSGSSGSATTVPAAQSSAVSTTAPAAPTTAPSSAPAPATPTTSSAPIQPSNTALPAASSTAPKVVGSGTATGGQACSSNGGIVCSADGKSWSMCNQGALTFMGAVAAGTTCSNGSIVKK